MNMQRMGLCIGLKPQVIQAYREIHAAVWPEVLAAITKANIRNYHRGRPNAFEGPLDEAAELVVGRIKPSAMPYRRGADWRRRKSKVVNPPPGFLKCQA
jgi:hypothetical protein